jgi:hypothetical protein
LNLQCQSRTNFCIHGTSLAQDICRGLRLRRLPIQLPGLRIRIPTLNTLHMPCTGTAHLSPALRSEWHKQDRVSMKARSFLSPLSTFQPFNHPGDERNQHMLTLADVHVLAISPAIEQLSRKWKGTLSPLLLNSWRGSRFSQTVPPILFLAGPTPWSRDVLSWRPEKAAQALNEALLGRLSLAVAPGSPFFPGSRSLIRSHFPSTIA